MFLSFILITCISTSLMTLFSYAVAALFKQQFREPELLNMLAIRLRILNRSSKKNHPLGWMVHYVVGLGFVVILELIRAHAGISPAALYYYILAGAGCGIIGIGMWYVTFKTHPDPPRLWFAAFYIQLLFAHIVFGTGIWLSGQLGIA